MSSLNKVMLIGRLGRDPEMRYFPNGDGVCNFSLATSETWNDKQTGQRQERTEWHNISLRGRVAEVATQYLKKGSLVLIEGKIQSRKYTDKNGIERTAYEIIGYEMKMLGSKNDSGMNQAPYSPDYDEETGTYSAPPKQPYAAPAANPPAYTAPPQAPEARKEPIAPAMPVEDIDDDIPF